MQQSWVLSIYIADTQPYSVASAEGPCAAWGWGAEGNIYTGEGRVQDHSKSEDRAVCICIEGECAFYWGEGKETKLCGGPLANRMRSSGCVSCI